MLNQYFKGALAKIFVKKIFYKLKKDSDFSFYV